MTLTSTAAASVVPRSAPIIYSTMDVHHKYYVSSIGCHIYDGGKLNCSILALISWSASRRLVDRRDGK